MFHLSGKRKEANIAAIDRSRRALFRGTNGLSEIRPPWSIDADLFTGLCTRCGDCATACEEHIIRSGDGGFPIVDFSKGECTFCGACQRACQTGAINTDSNSPPWLLKLDIDASSCLAFNRVVCRTCAEQCEPAAIQFQWGEKGVALPVVDADICNGCGACIEPCPTKSMSLSASAGSRQVTTDQSEENFSGDTVSGEPTP